MRLTLSTMPEELLERILAFAVSPSSPSSAQRPSSHPAYSNTRNTGVPSHVAPLLVSRTWLRIATPAFYRHIVLRSATQATLLAHTLKRNPELGRWVRSLRVDGTYALLPDVVRFCPALEEFDMTVDNGSACAQGRQASAQRGAEIDAAVVRFCAGFAAMRRLRHLVIRKNAYLTLPGPTHIFEQLGEAIRGWKYLESVHIAFRFSPSPASASFATSLAAAPRLRAVSALLPTVWNTALLEISQNPVLERIHLGPRAELFASQLFISEARKHPRLMELIVAGTPELPQESPARPRCAGWPVSSSLPGPGLTLPGSPMTGYPQPYGHPQAYAHPQTYGHPQVYGHPHAYGHPQTYGHPAYLAPAPASPPAPYQRLSQRRHTNAKPEHVPVSGTPRDPRSARPMPVLVAPPMHTRTPRRMSAV